MTPKQIKQESERRFPLSNNIGMESFNNEMEYKQNFFIEGATWMQSQQSDAVEDYAQSKQFEQSQSFSEKEVVELLEWLNSDRVHEEGTLHLFLIKVKSSKEIIEQFKNRTT